MSSNNMVTSKTSPTLLLLCDDDKVVESKSSVVYYEALVRHGVKCSMHIFPEGGHSLKKAKKEQQALILDWLNWLGLYNTK
jgi:dipeptidyl aminopeptidase/acylaminoacyl peptidase